MSDEQSTNSTGQTPVKKREWIAQYLSTVPIVEWDRFVVGEMDGYQYVNVYGWIDREDEYKDFVWSRFWPSNEAVEFTTSSDEYSEYIHAEWFGEDALDDHTPCRRVEHAFDIENAIQLREDASLAAFSDGGTNDGGEESTGGTDRKRPEPREAHCQCCGGYAGHGPGPRYCGTCRAAGEHLVICPMCEERVPRRSFDQVCPDCEATIDELDQLVQPEPDRGDSR